MLLPQKIKQPGMTTSILFFSVDPSLIPRGLGPLLAELRAMGVAKEGFSTVGSEKPRCWMEFSGEKNAFI